MGLRILFYTAIEGELGTLGHAIRRVHRDYGPVVKVVAYTKRDLTVPDKEAELLHTVFCCHMVILHLMGGPDSLPCFDRVTALAKERAIPLTVLPSAGDDAESLYRLSNFSAEDYRRVRLYVSYGGEENLKNLLVWAINRYLVSSLLYRSPNPSPGKGYTTRGVRVRSRRRPCWRKN